MLTMRYIEEDGHEVVKEVESVMRVPAKESVTKSAYLVYWNIDDKGSPVEIYDGTVYVMNEMGKTIANYVVSTKWVETE